MREIRLSGSEGGGFELNRFSLPLLRIGFEGVRKSRFGRALQGQPFWLPRGGREGRPYNSDGGLTRI